MCCHEMNHLHAIIRYRFFYFDVCALIFNVSYIKSFYEKYSMFVKSKILCMSFSVIETYDPKFCQVEYNPMSLKLVERLATIRIGSL